MKTCCIDGCDNPIKARQLCAMHYQRDRRHGDTGVNYSYRINRVFLNDVSTYIPSLRTPREDQILSELFCLGRHQGALTPNYNEAIGFGAHETFFEVWN